MSKVCFMFGHRDASEEILLQIERAVEAHYLQYGIREFVVGNRGRFDNLAARAVRSVKTRHADIVLTLLLAYYPASASQASSPQYDGSFYPDGMEDVPKKFAIVKANRHMLERADSIICFVNHPGNTAALLGEAQRRSEKIGMPIENLAAS